MTTSHRRSLATSLICLSLAAALLAGPATAKSASSSTAWGSPNQGATVLMDIEAGACALFDGDGGLVFGVARINVIASGANGNALHLCRLDAGNSTGTAVHYDANDNPFGAGIPCFIFDGTGGHVTLNWRETVSASGKATLICHNP